LREPAPIRKELWDKDESIRIQVKSASPPEKEENRKIAQVCVQEYNAVRIRITWGKYGPGTVDKPTPRYYWDLGESATVTCRTEDIGEWFVEELKRWIKSMDGVMLEVVE
jgi:hypothetical protein